MCEKCIKNPENHHTIYCDDWWDDTSHGGYKGDRQLKKEHDERKKRENKNKPP